VTLLSSLFDQRIEAAFHGGPPGVAERVRQWRGTR